MDAAACEGNASGSRADAIPCDASALGRHVDAIPCDGNASGPRADAIPCDGSALGWHVDAVPCDGNASGSHADAFTRPASATTPHMNLVAKHMESRRLFTADRDTGARLPASDESMIPPAAFAHSPSTIRLGDLEVARLGFGAMRLPGPDVWGEPEDPARAREVLRRAVALGVNLVDTAWFYGPHVANRLIAETLHPYPADLVIASKLGGKRLPDKSWAPFSRPDELREGCETDLRELRRDALDVAHLRYMGKGSPVPFAESLDAMIALQKEGKIRHLGLSNVGPAELEAALARTPIVSVQNLYSVAGGGGMMARLTHAEVASPERVVAMCEERGIAYMPFFPLGVGAHAKPDAAIAGGRGAPRRQARADRPRVAARAVAHHAPDPRHEPPRAPRGELERAVDPAEQGRSGVDRRGGARERRVMPQR